MLDAAMPAAGAGIDWMIAGYQVAGATACLVHGNQDPVDLVLLPRLPVRAAAIPLVV